MEKDLANDYVSFENDCEVLRGIALEKSSLEIESLNLNTIQLEERAGRISGKIEDILNDMYHLNRPYYFMFCQDIPSLYKLLKGTNRLHCPEEMEFLQQAMILKLVHDCLLMLMLEIDIREHVHQFFITGELKQECNLPQPGTLHGHAHFLSKGFQPEAFKGSPSNESKCIVSEEILYFIIVQLNQRLHFLKCESSIKTLIHWIRFPNQDQGICIPVGCKTNELRYIVDHFKLFNNDITFVNMELCGHFISRKGNGIKATCMGSSTIENLTTRHAIDHIFASALEKK